MKCVKNKPALNFGWGNSASQPVEQVQPAWLAAPASQTAKIQSDAQTNLKKAAS